MRIQNVNSNPQDAYVDLTELYISLKDQYTDVFMFQVENQVFLYKQLGRKDYKDLLELEVNDFEKEEILCKACVLYPQDYDFEECDAGIPSQLAKAILKNSFLDSLESRELLIRVFRQEMHELDNQVTCLIHEAFPEYSIEEIETWDLQRTAKFLSRAEWILANLREQQAAATNQPAQTYEIEDEEEDISPIQNGVIETIEERQARLKNQKGKKQRMTPEKLAELQAKYPEMNWGSNVFEEVTVDNLKDSVSVDSPALRPGW